MDEIEKLMDGELEKALEWAESRRNQSLYGEAWVHSSVLARAVRGLQKELDELKIERDQWRSDAKLRQANSCNEHAAIYAQLKKSESEVQELRAENQKMREALQADKDLEDFDCGHEPEEYCGCGRFQTEMINRAIELRDAALSKPTEGR